MNDDAFTPEPSAPSAKSPARGAWVIAGVLLGVLLFHAAALHFSDFEPDDVALGRNTVAFTASDGEWRTGGTLPELPALLSTARAARETGRPLVLWLGASQCYAVNHPEVGARTAITFAAEASAARGSPARWIQCASPNSNAHELLCMYLAFRQAGLSPKRLVVAFTYDDLKEPGIRDSAFASLSPLDAETLRLGGEAAARVEAERARFAAGLAAEDAASPVQRTATTGTPQEVLEEAIVAWLERHWSAWAVRGKLSAASVAWWKMPVTTLAFKLFDRPQVVIPLDRSAWNMSALRALLDLTASDGTRVLLYQAPHNPGLKPFYHPRAEYDRAQRALAAECEARHVDWVDFEKLVPAGLWGETNNFTPDVFHFRVEGHRLLGEAVAAAVAQRDG